MGESVVTISPTSSRRKSQRIFMRVDVCLVILLIKHTCTRFSKAAPLPLSLADTGAGNAGLGFNSPVKIFSAWDLSSKRWVSSGAREREDRVSMVPQLSVLLILEDLLR